MLVNRAVNQRLRDMRKLLQLGKRVSFALYAESMQVNLAQRNGGHRNRSVLLKAAKYNKLDEQE